MKITPTTIKAIRKYLTDQIQTCVSSFGVSESISQVRATESDLEMTSVGGASELLREHLMKQRVLTIPELILIAGTRVALGVGIGLSARRQTHQQRAACCWVGAGGCRRVNHGAASYERARQIREHGKRRDVCSELTATGGRRSMIDGELPAPTSRKQPNSRRNPTILSPPNGSRTPSVGILTCTTLVIFPSIRVRLSQAAQREHFLTGMVFSFSDRKKVGTYAQLFTL